MGPRLGWRGDGAEERFSDWDRYLLQWGHALVGVETFAYTPKGGREPKLQWGHALVGVETTV